MRAAFLACLVAIAALGAATAAGVWWATLDPGGGPSARAGGERDPTPARRAGEPGSPPPARAGDLPDPAPPGPAPGHPRPAPHPRRISPRHAALARAGGAAVPNAWESLRARVAPCLDRRNLAPVAASSSGPPPRPGDPAVLLLDAELHGGALEIVGAVPQGGAGASDPATRCAMDALRGQRIETGGGAEDEGTRVQIPFRLAR